MANTYTQLYIQAVFAVKFREGLLDPQWDARLRKYITAIVQNHGHKMISINNVDDHLHMFFGLEPKQSISELLKNVKSESSKWINTEGFCKKNFNWQTGFGAFSYSRADIPRIIRYIENQQVHHQKTSFKTEYIDMLTEHEIEFDPQYLFHAPE